MYGNQQGMTIPDANVPYHDANHRGAAGASTFHDWDANKTVPQQHINPHHDRLTTPHHSQQLQQQQCIQQMQRFQPHILAVRNNTTSPDSSITTNPSNSETNQTNQTSTEVIKENQRKVVEASTKAYDKTSFNKHVGELIKKDIKERLWFKMKFCLPVSISNFNELEKNDSILLRIVLDNTDEWKVAKNNGKKDLDFDVKNGLFNLYCQLIPRTLNELRTAKTKDIRVKMEKGEIEYLLF